MAVAASLVLLATIPTGATPVDPFVNAAPDWFVCNEPRESDKTCDSVVTVQKVGDHSYAMHTTSHVVDAAFIIEMDDKVDVVDGRHCSNLNSAGLATIQYRNRDRPLTKAEHAAAQAYVSRYKQLVGTQLSACTNFYEVGNKVLTRTEFIGQPGPNARVFLRTVDGEFRWIHKDEGYTLRRF